jgi:hypothetical protein
VASEKALFKGLVTERSTSAHPNVGKWGLDDFFDVPAIPILILDHIHMLLFRGNSQKMKCIDCEEPRRQSNMSLTRRCTSVCVFRDDRI